MLDVSSEIFGDTDFGGSGFGAPVAKNCEVNNGYGGYGIHV
jgi:hypothetical protein